MAYFSQSKSDKNTVNRSESERKPDQAPVAARPAVESASTLGRGMLVTGNITCAGSVQILGRVVGDIHATHLNIGEGAQVEGNVTAQEMVVHGSFKGTVHANSVKLQSTAVVEGEVFNKSLTIEQNAQFEGVSRRLEKAVEAPTGDHGSRLASAEIVPISGAIG
jgi:cytoskeletal protein CcmA (bactofilin family)